MAFSDEDLRRLKEINHKFPDLLARLEASEKVCAALQREIKFRAWDKLNEAWVPGGYGFHIIGESLLIGGLFQNMPLEMLNDIELMQFTGLKDKNGKEIYEGDVIKIEETAISENDAQKQIRGADIVQSQFTGTVEWDNETVSYNLMDEKGEIIIGFPRHEQTYEVIGNIYETPEFLTGGKEGV